MRRERLKLPVMPYRTKPQQGRIEARLKKRIPFYIEADGLKLYVGSNGYV